MSSRQHTSTFASTGSRSRRASDIAHSLGLANISIGDVGAGVSANTVVTPRNAFSSDGAVIMMSSSSNGSGNASNANVDTSIGMSRRSGYPSVSTPSVFGPELGQQSNGDEDEEAWELQQQHDGNGDGERQSYPPVDYVDRGEGPSNSSSSYAFRDDRGSNGMAYGQPNRAMTSTADVNGISQYGHPEYHYAGDDSVNNPLLRPSTPRLPNEADFSHSYGGNASHTLSSPLLNSHSSKSSPSRFKRYFQSSPANNADNNDFKYSRSASSSVINILSLHPGNAHSTPPKHGNSSILPGSGSASHTPSGSHAMERSASGLSPPAGPAWLLGTLGVGGGRKRGLHPCTLIPAFLFGAILALSGIFGGRAVQQISTKHSTTSQQQDSSTTLWLPWSSSSSSSSDASTASQSSIQDLLSNIARPPYTHHSSGHIYMDQARTSLGTIEHPIHALIANATVQWESLLSKQSKTLAQAVKEYRRRYGRNPPKGFDRWFKFAQDNGVILIDEYDQISKDILPFTALSQAKLAERVAEIESNEFVHTFVVRNGKITITGAKKELARASDQAELMKNFVQFLPDVNITMSAHDGPSVAVDWQLRERHVKAASAGKKISDKEADMINDDPAWFGWNLACPPTSRIQRQADGLEAGALPVGPSFIEDHRATTDMCRNPEWQYTHGFTSWQGPRPRHLQPLFSFSKTSMHADLLCVPLEQFINTPTSDPEWEDKPFDKIIWRGSMTGVWFDSVSWWRSSQRTRLHYLSQAKTGSRYVRFLHQGQSGKSTEKIVERNIEYADLNKRYLDAAYVGELHQCTETDGSCQAVPKHIDVVPGLIWEAQNDYKYIIDTDGNAWSGRFHRLMASNSLVLKSTIFPEWYSDRLVPWYHYVPVRIDYSDLYDIMAFFAGDMDHKNGHDELAKKIAYQGKDWTNKHWRMADMETYCYRLYLEWARVTAIDQSDVDYLG